MASATSLTYQLVRFMPWSQEVCLVILIAAALVHWQRTRHWCLPALATSAILVALSALANKIAWMYPDHTLASGAVYGNESLLLTSVWLQVFSQVVAVVGGIGAIQRR